MRIEPAQDAQIGTAPSRDVPPWSDRGRTATMMEHQASDDQFADQLRAALPVLGRFVASQAPELDRDDVVQDVVARAWRKRQVFDPDRSHIRTWLLAIARDQIGQHRRSRWRSHTRWKFVSSPDDGMMDASSSASPDDNLLWAIRKLPAKQQESIFLRYYVGLDVAEIAEVQNVATGTVKSSLSDGRTNLKRILEGAHHDQ